MRDNKWVLNRSFKRSWVVIIYGDFAASKRVLGGENLTFFANFPWLPIKNYFILLSIGRNYCKT